LIHGLGQVSAGKVHILAQVQKDHRQAAILANGQALIAGDVRVFQKPIQDLPPHRRLLALPGLGKGGADIIRQKNPGFGA
jgi:hypothetical protein